jgi:myo-inositol-1(or 4)-monophosphatase
LLAEEGVGVSARKEFTWIIDPLDGTVNFIHQLPLFSVSVALMREGEVVCGVVHAPILGETFVARKGGGAWRNGERLHVSSVGTIVRSLAVTGFSYDIRRKAAPTVNKFRRVVERAQGVRRLGSAALDLAYVAAGRFELFWEEDLAPWDVAAGALLVEEAGGKVSDLYNGTDYIFGKTLLATNGKVHAAALKLVGEKKSAAPKGAGR